MTLEQTLFRFLNQYYDRFRPVLLGLSGGTDSLALFYLLQLYKDTIEKEGKDSFFFGIAHVDHGWRSESEVEANQLQELANKMHIPFHLKKLNPLHINSNLEQACRHERLSFFAQLCNEHQYQAVILGHHADDRSETVLKKILEGSSLPYLHGMTPVSKYQELTLWRPLLNCLKSHLKLWLDKRGYTPFEDSTNLDEKFLRGRFRKKIIPELSKDFGKEVSSSLCRIGLEAEELKTYLDNHLKGYIEGITKGPFGSMLDFENSCPTSDFEIKYLIRKLCEMEGLRLSHHLIGQACQKIHENSANCYLFVNKKSFYIDRRRLFIVRQPLTDWSWDTPICLGQSSINGWNIYVCEIQEDSRTTGWKEAWMGHMQIQVPEGQYVLKQGNSSLFKWWTQAKVPAILRRSFPTLWSGNSIIHEFLTKRRFSNIINSNRKKWLISIHYP